MEKLKVAHKDYKQLQPDIGKLEAYYTSSSCEKDLKLEEDGKLPVSLKRGVLSEAGIYDLQEWYNNKMR